MKSCRRNHSANELRAVAGEVDDEMQTLSLKDRTTVGAAVRGRARAAHELAKVAATTAAAASVICCYFSC